MPRSLKARLTSRLLKAWYPADPGRRDWLSLALLDVSWLYRGLTAARRWLYARGVFDTKRLAVPVVVVGNVIAGGAGKTPVVIELVRHLQSRGLKVGVISRGYGRTSRTTLTVTADTPVQDSGDEPALIARVTGAPVCVAAERIQAARQLLTSHPDMQVIVSDDGLQHLQLGRDIDIIVFDARGVGNGRLIPAGPLREPWPRAAPRALTQPWPRTALTLHTGGMDGFHIERQTADDALRHDGSRLKLRDITTPILALAGIANPQAFFDALRDKNLPIHHTLALPDHYIFDSIPSNIDEGQTVICTEKDAIKLWQQHPGLRDRILAVPLVLTLPADFLQAFDTTVDNTLSSRHGCQTA